MAKYLPQPVGLARIFLPSWWSFRRQSILDLHNDVYENLWREEALKHREEGDSWPQIRNTGKLGVNEKDCRSDTFRFTGLILLLVARFKTDRSLVARRLPSYDVCLGLFATMSNLDSGGKYQWKILKPWGRYWMTWKGCTVTVCHIDVAAKKSLGASYFIMEGPQLERLMSV